MTEQSPHTGTGSTTPSQPNTASPAAVGFIEQGHLFKQLAGLDGDNSSTTPDQTSRAPQPRERSAEPEDLDVIVIGGGQAGLSVGHFLAKQNLHFVILDARERIGDVWRSRWDSLKLFTPTWLDSLPGFPYPGPRYQFPTKAQMGDYLEAYAAHFRLPIRTNARVELVNRRDGRYVVWASGREYRADHVVVAMSSYQRPKVPAFARLLDPKIVQLHSSAYRNLDQLRLGPTLVAGAGNSGCEIALEAVRAHQTFLSGRDTGHLPFHIESFWGRLLFCPLLLRVLFHRVFTRNNALGRFVRPKILHKGSPLIRLKPQQLAAAGVTRVPRVTGVRDGLPLLEDGRVLKPSNIVWCTGFDPGLSFIELPIFDEHGDPKHVSGIVPNQPGLYFVGQAFLHAFSSAMIHGVSRDAERIASTIAERRRQQAASPLRAAAAHSVGL
jgi:putative flavoprotein involved in K+ transport